MDRRTALKTIAGAVAAPAVLRGRHPLFAGVPTEYSARAIRLVEESTVVDLLCQFRFGHHDPEGRPEVQRWLDAPSAFTDADFAVYRDSGMDVFALGHGARDYEDGLRFFARWNGFIASHADKLVRVDEARDFEAVPASGKVGLLLSFQNSEHFRRPDDVNEFFALGQRISQLTYNYGNRIGDGFLEHRDGGLTVFGHEILERMNQVGMAVDVSHCADVTTMDALDAAAAPVVFTHATCRALLPGHRRCKTDEAIRALARTGGVMGIAWIRFMIRDREPVELEHVLDHYDHVKRLVGPEHVAIGSDVDVLGEASPLPAPDAPPRDDPPNWDRYQIHMNEQGRENIAGLDHPKRVYDLTDGLIGRGWSDDEIRLVLGGNAVRVLSAIWEG